MSRRTWLPSLLVAAIAALGVAVAFVVSARAFESATATSWFEAAHRSMLSQMTVQMIDQLRSEHRTPAQIAHTVVERLDAMPNVTAAVVDNNGQLIAGNAALVADLRFPGPPPPGAIGMTGFEGLPPPGLTVQVGSIDQQLTSESARPGNSPRHGPKSPSQAQPNDKPLIENKIYFQDAGYPPLALFGSGGTHLLSGRGPEFGYVGLRQWSWLFGKVGMSRTLVPLGGETVVIGTTNAAITRLQTSLVITAVGLIVLTFALVLLRGRQVLAGALQPADRVHDALMRFTQNAPPRPELLAPEGGIGGRLIDAYNAAANKITNAFRHRVEAEYRMRQFVADAGHELRTPLAVIMGYVQLLRQGAKPDDATAGRIFSAIDEQGQRISVLIHKLLLLTRWESQDPTDVKILDAADIAAAVVESFRPLAKDSTLNLNAHHDAFVQVSESEMREAIGNLIDNALKYAPGSTIDTTVRTQNGFVAVTVSDNGPGMTPDVRAHAFERFSRGELAGSISGSGLGLAIVRRVVERAGGTVSLESALGHGTKIELRIPAWHPDGTTRADNATKV